MRANASLTVSLLGLLLAAPALANAQESAPGGAAAVPQYALPPDAIIDEIRFVGLHRIPTETAKSLFSFHPGEKYSSAQIASDLRALNRMGWFEDLSVNAEESHDASQTAGDLPPHFTLTFHVREYPFLAGVEYTGSKVLSQPQIDKLLKDNVLSPEVRKPVSPAKLHSAAMAIQEELRATGHPEGHVLVTQEKLSGQRVTVEFQVFDGPRIPVIAVHFSGNPEVPESTLRKQMHEIAPYAWFSGLRSKNVFTQQKGEKDRLNLLTYLQNHGFPQARVGTPQVTSVESSSGRSFPWLRHHSESGLSVGMPVDVGNLYRFGPLEVSGTLREKLQPAKKRDTLLSNVAPGHPFSQQAVDSLQRNWELRLHRNAQRHKGDGNYRLRAVPTFDHSTHLASLKFVFDPTPPYIVRRIDFRGNKHFPDRFLRRRIGLTEGQPFDQYALEAGLARLAQTGYFQPFKKEDIQIEPHETGHAADVTIHVHEKGRQRTTFSGGREQFGSTLGIAYTVFNLLGMDEFLSTQLDGGPQTLQLAAGLAIEGVLGSRGTLALSLFDTFLRPHFAPGVHGPFERSRTEGENAGWSYAASDVDSLGVNYGISRSLTRYSFIQSAGSSGRQPPDPRSGTSSHAIGIAWTHYDSAQKIQLADSVSGGVLGGSENLLRSQAAYGRIFPDEVFDNHNAWAFRTTVRAAGSYKGDMPLYARFFSGDDLVRGLRPGELGPYGILSAVSPSGATTYSAAPTGANLVAASNLEYRFPLGHGFEGATFFDTGSGLLLPNWLGPSRLQLIHSTNGLLHASTGFEVRWTLPAVGVPLRLNYSFNILRLNRTLLMPDGSIFRLRNRAGVLGWGIGQFF